ncbi:MAG: glucose 1-dehydrogenase [Actinobacteria bacterium]|nr:glucose 1-dehydrogenase [Actinomycetota bacterium]
MSANAADAALARFDLSGRVAAITGAASGLGFAMATAFAEHGADVAILDVDEQGAETAAKAVKDLGRASCSMAVDVRKPGDLDEACARVLGELGRVDILVNSAGVVHRSPAEHFPDELFDRVIDINLKGTFYGCRSFGRAMLAAGGGCIINMASIGGLVGYPESAAYIASKGAIVQLTRGLAVEWADRNVRVNAIAPSVIDTPLSHGAGVLASSEPAGRGTKRSSFIMERTLKGPGAIGHPRDVSGVAVFLASDAARMITGHTLPVDDGYTAA